MRYLTTLVVTWGCFLATAASLFVSTAEARPIRSHSGLLSAHRSGHSLGWAPAPARTEFENELEISGRDAGLSDRSAELPKKVSRPPAVLRSVFSKRAAGIGPLLNGIPSDHGSQVDFPPDAQVAVGAGAVVEMANSFMSVWTTGGVSRTSMDLRTFARSSDDLGDPRVMFDALSGRWFAAIMDGTPGSYGVFIAVSYSADPAGGWWMYKWDSTSCLDQPRIGVTNSTVSFTANAFSTCVAGGGGTYTGTQIWVLNKTNLVAGASVNYRYYDPDPRFPTLSPAQSLTATDTQYMVSVSRPASAAIVLALRGTPPDMVTSSLVIVPVARLDNPPAADQPGSPNSLATNDVRSLDSVWQNGKLFTTTNDACTPQGDSVPRSCGRILVFDTTTSSRLVDQDLTLGPGTSVFFPALRPDGAGNLVVAFGYSSSTVFPSAGVAIRSVAGQWIEWDPLSVGTTLQTSGRWGDYFGASADADNPARVWVVASSSVVGGWAGHGWSTTVAGVTVVGSVAAVPTISYSAPSAIAVNATSATLTASVNAQGSATSYRFEYGTTLSYESATAPATLTTSSAFQPVSAAISGLTPSTTYHFRLTATNTGGSASGIDQVFTTSAAQPTTPTPTIPTPTPTPTTTTQASHEPVLVLAQSASGVRGKVMRLEYTFGAIASDTNTYEVLTIGKYTVKTRVHHLDGDVFVRWLVPKSAPKQMKFCVQSFERPPYSGMSRDCAPIFVS